MSDLIKRKKELDEELQEYIEASGNVMTMSAIGSLMEKLTVYFADMTEIAAKSKYFDKDLSSKIESSISELKTAFSNIQPPTIKVTPNINVDFKPLQAAFQNISEGQNTFISLIEEMKNGNNSDEIMRLLTAVANRQLAFLEKGIQQIDITPQLNKISEGINKRPTEWEAAVTEWNNQGRLSKLKIKVTK